MIILIIILILLFGGGGGYYGAIAYGDLAAGPVLDSVPYSSFF
jgi:hypothetical protein